METLLYIALYTGVIMSCVTIGAIVTTDVVGMFKR